MTEATERRLLENEVLRLYRVLDRYRRREIDELKEVISKEAGEAHEERMKLKAELRRSQRDFKEQAKHRLQDLARIDELEQKLLEVVAPEPEEE